jgi:hypothetical protein
MNSKDLQKKHFILKTFDFKKVETTMTSLNWKWATCNRVPNIEQLKSCASSLMDCAYKESTERTNGQGYCSTGGFVAEYRGNNFWLSFVIEEAVSNDMEDNTEDIEKETPSPLKTQNPILSLNLSE